MKTLYLLRHAKSSWDDADCEDFDRPLNARGRRAAERIGRHLAERKARPELVLCSAAQRARATWALAAPAIVPRPAYKELRSLYLAPPSRILAILRRLPDTCGAVMVVGHNPGIGRTVELLAGSSWPKFPTGALAAIRLDIGRWNELCPGRGRLMFFTTPAELSERVS